MVKQSFTQFCILLSNFTLQLFPPSLNSGLAFVNLHLIFCFTSIAYVPLTQKNVPQYKIKSFYVRKPIPEPKRDCTGDCTNLDVLFKRTNPHGAKVKQLNKYHCTTTPPNPIQVQPQSSGPILVRQPKHSSMPIVDWNMWHMWINIILMSKS